MGTSYLLLLLATLYIPFNIAHLSPLTLTYKTVGDLPLQADIHIHRLYPIQIPSHPRFPWRRLQCWDQKRRLYPSGAPRNALSGLVRCLN